MSSASAVGTMKEPAQTAFMRYFTDHDLYQCPDGIALTLRAAMADARADPAIIRLSR